MYLYYGFWISISELGGYGFPFDQTHLVWNERIEKAIAHIQKLKNASIDNQTTSQLQKILATIVDFDHLTNTVQQAREKVAIFEQLRKAMRIAIPAEKQGIKDLGNNISINVNKTRVTAFRDSKLKKKASKNKAYQNMLKQLDKLKKNCL